MRHAARRRVPRPRLAERYREPIAAHDAQTEPLEVPPNASAPNAVDDPDDPDEATVADTVGADDEPTTIRPTPLPPHLTLWEGATAKDPTRGRGTRSRGRVGKYQLQTRLARGAFGVVYTAHDPNLERNVAIKVLRPTHLTNHDVVQRFLQEARATARIGHPGIVTIHDCGTVETRRGPTAFIAMELLSGESLTSRLAHVGRLAPAAACEIARQVASALEAAHHVDVLHRDLKPDNIYLVPDPAMPSGERVKVLDFGLAKLGASGLTQLQTVFGTPRYMSPEQSRSATQIDRRSDIYSLGCVLFELVTGRPVFDGDVRQLIERHQWATPARASVLVPAVPAVLDDLIADMLAKDPAARPQTMAAVQRALRFAAGRPGSEPIAAAPSEPPAPVLSLPLPLPPPTGSQMPPIVRPPSSPPVPIVRPPSSPPTLPGRPPTPPPALVMPSIEISISCAPPRRPENLPPVTDDGAMSGEVIVPAGSTSALAAPDPAPVPLVPTGRWMAVFWLCVLVAAALAAIAAATMA